jgi:hypothetical protein
MFTAEERDRVREQLLARAEADSAVVGAAVTGSYATGDGDRWSLAGRTGTVPGAGRHHRRRDG